MEKAGEEGQEKELKLKTVTYHTEGDLDTGFDAHLSGVYCTAVITTLGETWTQGLTLTFQVCIVRHSSQVCIVQHSTQVCIVSTAHRCVVQHSAQVCIVQHITQLCIVQYITQVCIVQHCDYH